MYEVADKKSRTSGTDKFNELAMQSVNVLQSPESTDIAKEMAFIDLYEESKPLIINYLLGHGKTPEDAEDIFHEAMIRVNRSVANFESRAKFSTWLLQIVKNLCLDSVDYASRRPSTTSFDGIEESSYFVAPLDSNINPEVALERNLTLETVDRALEEIDPRYREAMVRRDLYGQSYPEISQAQGIPLSATKWYIYSARQAAIDAFEAERQKAA